MSSQNDRDDDKQRALIIGCGYLGVHVGTMLHERGWHVSATTTRAHRTQALEALGFAPVVFDFSQDNSFSSIESARPDVVICAAAPGRNGDADLVFRSGPRLAAERATAGGAKRFVFVSSTGVYHQSDGSWVDEDSPAEPSEPRHRVLRQGERDVLALGGVVLRLGGLYGPGRSPVDWLRRSETHARILAGSAEAWMNWIRVEDAARLAVLAAENGKQAQIYLGVDGHPVQRAAFYARAAELAGLPAPSFVHNPHDLGKRCTNRRTCEVLGFKPQHASFHDGLVGTSKDT